MVFWLTAPFQDHATSIDIAGVGEVVWESIANVGHVLFFLAQMEMAGEHTLESTKVIYRDFAMIGHLHHGIHLEVRQLEMPKHVSGAHFLYAPVIISDQPGRDHYIAFLEPVVADDDVGYVPGPGRTMDVTPVSVVEIMIARYEVELVKRPAQSFQGLQAKVQGLEIDAGPVMVPVAQEQTGLAAVLATSLDDPIHETGAVLIVQQAVRFQAKVYVRESDSPLE